MKINAITSNISFRAGKTKLYTDFDGTYFPTSQYFVQLKIPSDISMLQNMYNSFQRFFDAAQEQFAIIITTGRNMFNFENVLNLFKNSNIDIPPFQGYIFEDGLEEMKNYDMEDFSLNPDYFPNKLYQPKQEVKKIVEKNSNDLVIVAGNDWNDVDMLNPLNYIDIFGAEYNHCISLEELLDRKDVINAIKNLPLVSIVAGDSDKTREILKIKHLLDERGIHKIFHAKKPQTELLQKIKQGMQVYSLENSEYKNNLSAEIQKEILY